MTSPTEMTRGGCSPMAATWRSEPHLANWTARASGRTTIALLYYNITNYPRNASGKPASPSSPSGNCVRLHPAHVGAGAVGRGRRRHRADLGCGFLGHELIMSAALQ